MMGIPVRNPVYIYGDNQSVLWNTTIPDSTLKKKRNSIAYNFVGEGVARDECRTSYIKADANQSNLMTKALPAGITEIERFEKLCTTFTQKKIMNEGD